MSHGQPFLDTLLQIDPNILKTLKRHAHDLDAGDLTNIVSVLHGGFCVYDRDWRKATFRVLDAMLIDLDLPHEQPEERLNARLYPFSSYFGQRMAKALLPGSRARHGIIAPPCLSKLEKLTVGSSYSTARAFTFWNFTNVFFVEMSKFLKDVDVKHFGKWASFVNCLVNADRYDASKVVVSYLNNSELSETIFKLSRAEIGDIMSLMQSLIDDSNEFSDHLKVMLKDLVKRHEVLPNSLVIKDIEQVGRASVANGGMADIFKGKITSTGKMVALKVPRGIHLDEKPKTKLKEVFGEAIVWRQLKHDNIIPFLGIVYNIPCSSIALVSPWIVDGPLDLYLKIQKDVDGLNMIANGMCFLHNAERTSFIHGDLRAGNILVDSNQRLLITDFGLSKFRTIQTEVKTAEKMGTLRWKAPETLEDDYFKGHPTTASDVYAFGMTCLEVFTREVPYKGISDVQVMRKVLLENLTPARPKCEEIFARGLDDRVWTILCRCWERDPNLRLTMKRIYEFLTDPASNVVFDAKKELRKGIFGVIAALRLAGRSLANHFSARRNFRKVGFTVVAAIRFAKSNEGRGRYCVREFAEQIV